MRSERIGHWTRMRHSRAQFSGLGSLVNAQSLAGFITITCGFEFSVHTGAVPQPQARPGTPPRRRQAGQRHHAAAPAGKAEVDPALAQAETKNGSVAPEVWFWLTAVVGRASRRRGRSWSAESSGQASTCLRPRTRTTYQRLARPTKHISQMTRAK